METYLPILKATLSDWILLTLNNPLYAAALAITVWLLTAIVYSIKIASLKKKIVAGEKARFEIEKNFNTAQQKMQLMQAELTAGSVEMENARQTAQKEAQRATSLEEQLLQRNKQIAGAMQALSTSFDIGERPLPVTENIKAEDLWQQLDRVINLLAIRLRSEQQAKTELQQSYQAEAAKRAEKEALLETLQTTLANQNRQISQLERGLEEQKNLLREQQEKAQQILSQTLEKHADESARLAQLELQILELTDTRQQLSQLEKALNVKNAQITQLEHAKPVDKIEVQAHSVILEPEEKQEEKEGPVAPVELEKIDKEIQPAQPLTEEQADSAAKEPTGGVTGKFKNLFGKARQEPVAVEPETVEIAPVEADIQPVQLDVEPLVSPVKEPVAGVKGKFKNLFGKTRQEPVNVVEPELVENRQHETEIQPVPIEVEQHSVSSTKGQFGKLKNLLGSKPRPEEIQQEEKTEPAPVEVEQQPVNPAKGQLGKFKNLFGKNK
ncbi:MAG: hypothetical protein PHG00_17200 [Methylococcales bacterium]|nr:hypothetical protein [Methylococcales bacterium]